MKKTNQKQKDAPDNWETKTLEQVCMKKGLVRGPFGGALKKEFFVDFGYKVYEQKNTIYSSVDLGNYYINEEKFQELKRFSVKPNDFIISCSGTIGKIYRVPEGAPSGVINQALLKITIDDSIVNHGFFYSHFILPKFQSLVIDNTQGGAMQNLVGMDIFRTTKMLIPPLYEQNRIVTVLETWDQAIKKLKQKIEIKKQIKKGLMQDLLTGKKRLPGFSGEWEEKKIGNFCDFRKGRGLPKSEIIDSGRYKCVHYGELFTKYSEKIVEIISRTNYFKNAVTSLQGDVLFPTSDVTPRGLSTASVIYEDGVVLGGDILIVRQKEEIMDGLFFSYWVNSNKSKIISLVSGTTVFHLYSSDLSKLKLKLPSIKEQKAVSKILVTADEEINNLERKLTFWQQQKKYLLNNLVTGQIRTPENLLEKVK